MKKLGNNKISRVVWNGPLVKTLERVYGDISPVALFVSRARNLRMEHRIQGPPFNPFEYAGALGIRVEIDSALMLDGFVRKDSNGCFVVTLKKEVSAQRRNFTLAHEIAHTFFYDDFEEYGIKFRGHAIFDPEEERLCDMAAAEMLMPYGLFHRDLLALRRDSLTTLASLTRIANRYNVSLTAAAYRATSVIENLICVRWEKGALITKKWSSPGYEKRIVLCETGSTSVERAFKNPGQMITSDDRFYVSDRWIVRTTCSICTKSGEVWSLIQPGRLPKAALSNEVIAESNGAAQNRQPGHRSIDKGGEDYNSGQLWLGWSDG